MLTGPVIPPLIGGFRFFEFGAQPFLDHILQFASNCDGGRLQKTMGHLVELGILVFGNELLAESSFAPPDTYQRCFKKLHTFSKSF